MSEQTREDPQQGDLYRDKANGATFEVRSCDAAYVRGVRSDYGSWSVRRPAFDRFYEHVPFGGQR